MKTKMFRVVFFIGIFFSLYGAQVYAVELTKEFHEEFEADQNTLLKLKNKYGNIDIRNWDKPSVKIDVIVMAKHSSTEKAEKALESIDVKFSTSGNTISAETVIDDKFSRSSSWKNGNDFEINYTVQMPAEISLDLSQKYGHVLIEEVAGHANIVLNYGKLTVHKLSRGNVKPLNKVSLAYANGSSITECSWLKADIKYSSLEIEKAKAFVGYTSYMKLAIDEASSVVIEGKYDGYTLGTLANLVINTRYSTVKVKQLNKKLEADTKYTGVTIGSMPAGFEGININSAYGTYRIGLDENASYNLEGEASYSKIYYHEGGSVSRIQENNSMQVSGTVGSASNPSAAVKINTRYGNIKLDE